MEKIFLENIFYESFSFPSLYSYYFDTYWQRIQAVNRCKRLEVDIRAKKNFHQISFEARSSKYEFLKYKDCPFLKNWDRCYGISVNRFKCY